MFEGESFKKQCLTDSNIGCKMLKNMGWTGGSLKQGGIAEPVEWVYLNILRSSISNQAC